MSKKIKALGAALLIFAGAAGYMTSSEGKELLKGSEEGTVLIETQEEGTEEAVEETEAEGLTEVQKEELDAYLDAYMEGEGKEAVYSYAEAYLKESIERMLAEGKLAPAVSNYLNVQAGLVNINTATAAELMTLPGIGEAKAEAIIAYREENGAFSSVEGITEVSGISEKTLEKFKDRITV